MSTCIHGVELGKECGKCNLLKQILSAQNVADSTVPEDNVRIFNGVTPYELDPDLMLKKAVGQTKKVVIVGWDHDGKLFFSSSEPAGPEVLWLLEKAKQALLEIS